MAGKHKVVQLLASDKILVKEFAQFYRALDLNEGELVQLENSFRNNTITPYDLFSGIIDTWRSRTDGEFSKLCELLRKERFELTAANLETVLGIQPVSNNVWFEIGDVTKNFVGRSRELEMLEKFYNEKELTIVTGMGGVGKTELVKMFAKSKQHEINCVSLNGDSPESLTRSIIGLCETIGVRARSGDRNRDPIQLYSEIIRKLKRVLLIVDNVDKSNELCRDLLTSELDIFIIVTSRNLAVIDAAGQQVDLDVLNHEDVKCLIKLSLKDESDEDIDSLGIKLQNFPLALQQAVGFIKTQKRLSTRGKSYRIRNYLDSYEEQKTKLLDFKLNPFEHKYKQTTLITWNISIDKIKANEEFGEISLHLLDIIAYFNPDLIHVDFLEEIYRKLYGELADCNGGVELIKENCLVKVEDCVISIHRLIQEVIRQKLVAVESNMLMRLLQAIGVKEFTKEQIPHILAVWRHAMKHDELLREFSKFPDHLAVELYRLALFYDMLEIATTSSERLNFVLGDDHVDALNLVSSIPHAMRSIGKLVEALPVYKEVYEKIKRVLGDEHMTTLTTANNMATTFYYLGKYTESLEVHRRVHGIKMRLLGDKHSSTLISLANIATTLSDLGQFKAALDISHQVLEVQREVHGAESVRTLITVSNIGSILIDLGKYDEALQMCERAYMIGKRDLIENHPDILSTARTLGVIFRKLGKYNEAMEILQQTYENSKQILGDEYQSTLLTANELALVHIDIGNFDEAQRICQGIYPALARVLGEEHPATLTTIRNTALVLLGLGKYEEALVTLRQVFEKRKLVLGKQHPLTLFTASDMANALKKLGRYDEAVDILRDVYSKMQEVLGNDHPSTVEVANNVAQIIDTAKIR